MADTGPIVVTLMPAEEGGYVIDCPALGAVSEGDTVPHALEMLADAVRALAGECGRRVVAFQSRPNPSFPAGCRVRVRPLHPCAAPGKLLMVGRVGTVVRSVPSQLLVEFAGADRRGRDAVRWHFGPGQVERADDDSPTAA
jgi:hypothetical protein